jgi:hypothetical protein
MSSLRMQGSIPPGISIVKLLVMDSRFRGNDSYILPFNHTPNVMPVRVTGIQSTLPRFWAFEIYVGEMSVFVPSPLAGEG